MTRKARYAPVEWLRELIAGLSSAYRPMEIPASLPRPHKTSKATLLRAPWGTPVSQKQAMGGRTNLRIIWVVQELSQFQMR